jgi:hypothetical protein
MSTIAKLVNLSRASVLVRNSRLYSSAGMESFGSDEVENLFLDFDREKQALNMK